MTQTNRLNIAEPGGFWFFAYGSLMWDPPFPPADSQPARIYGYHRSFCVSSENYRGTPEKPGLSLGLDQGRILHRRRPVYRRCIARARYPRNRGAGNDLRPDLYLPTGPVAAAE
jgi:cation transport regulator ChaC